MGLYVTDAPQPMLTYLANAVAHHERPYTRPWMNGYRDNNDGTGCHADRPARKTGEAIIPLLSLWATRGFLTRPGSGEPSTMLVVHGGGDLIVVGGRCHQGHHYSAPKQKQPAGPRLSLSSSGPVTPA